MNFFGHAFSASVLDPDPRFVLGAMLPDFATMTSTAVAAELAPEIERGVACHHHSDNLFHRLPEFRSASGSLTARLAQRGVGRGGSLAAGHVGIELLLDGRLTQTLPGLNAIKVYQDAILLAGDTREQTRLLIERDTSQSAHRKLKRLATALGDNSVTSYADIEVCADRLLRVLSRRPRLAIPDHQRQPLIEEMATSFAELERLVSAVTGPLLTELAANRPDEDAVGQSPPESSNS